MDSEQNMPEVQSHQGSSAAPVQDGESQYAGSSIPHGMGQSKSSRRRRRKRKSKGPEVGAQPQADAGQAGQVPAVQASAQPQGSQQPAGQPFQGNGQQQNNSGGKRWKKKFRDRDRPRPQQQNPGNVADFNGNGSGGGFRDTHQPGNNMYKRSKGGG